MHVSIPSLVCELCCEDTNSVIPLVHLFIIAVKRVLNNVRVYVLSLVCQLCCCCRHFSSLFYCSNRRYFCLWLRVIENTSVTIYAAVFMALRVGNDIK